MTACAHHAEVRPPQISLPLGLQYTAPPSFVLNCSSSGSPATHVTWNRDGAELTHEDYPQTQKLRDKTSATYDNLLTVTDGKAGVYECRVENSRGFSLPASIAYIGKLCDIVSKKCAWAQLE